MRDIKFRIWDGVKNEWLASSNKYALPYYGFALVGEVMTVQSPPIWSLDEGNIVEQFTGLKDINGREIYEGDILIDDTGEPIEYWVVKFSNGVFIGECAGVAESLFELANLEVVGNIHEDSELLEEKG
ncbi:MAG: YopX family protein [Candidatus Nanosynbacter sp. P11B_S7_bin.28.1]|nr:YopX family protein [Candidatus Nanosynbacter sp. P11B_S7_bin.28.1]